MTPCSMLPSPATARKQRQRAVNHALAAEMHRRGLTCREIGQRLGRSYAHTAHTYVESGRRPTLQGEASTPLAVRARRVRPPALLRLPAADMRPLWPLHDERRAVGDL